MISTISDELAPEEEGRQTSPTFLSDLGNRLATVYSRIGEDKSVAVTERSWRQLSRYQAGAEPPVGVVKSLAETAGVSFEWLISGHMRSARDAEFELATLERTIHGLEGDPAKSDRLTSALKQFAATQEFLESSKEWERSKDDDLFERPVRRRVPSDKSTLNDANTGIPPGFVMVPRLDIRPSAGPGSLTIYDESEPDIFAFKEDFLRRIGVSPQHARLMVADGDSMWDTINDGGLMIVDISIREITNGAIYVLVYGGMVLLKRLQVLRSGVLLLKSDNPKYETEQVQLNEQPELIIEGRVRWAGGSI